jgi:hypothetical protein
LAFASFILAAKFVGPTRAQLLDGIDARGLEQLGELLADPPDPHEIRHIGPLQQLRFIQPAGRRDLAPTLGAGAMLEEIIRGVDPTLLNFER